MTQPTNLPEILSICRNLFVNDSTFHQWREFRDYMLNNKEAALSAIGKATIPELNRYAFKDKKDRMVRNVYNSLMTTINLSDSFVYCPTEESYESAFIRITDKYTEQDFLNYKAKLMAEHAAKVKAVNNPETLEEFNTFIRLKGEKALTEDQRIKYDELRADIKKVVAEKEEKRKAEVKQVQGVAAEMELKETVHTKKNIPLFVVVLSQRVERPVYEELNNRAKKLGGYYSSYNKGGAIPGFTFEKREAAELFMQVKDGNVNASEFKQEQAQEKQQTAAELLKEKGQKQIEEGEDELNRDRKDNTHRRATQAAHAEKAASDKIKFGKTLVKISEAMEAGNIKYIDKIRNSADLHTLNSILSAAKYKHIRAENINSDEYETTEKTVFFAEIPYPVLYDGYKTDLLRMQDVSNGKKLAAARMLKRFAVKNDGSLCVVCNTSQSIEDYEILFCSPCIVWPSWRVKNSKDHLMNLKRLQRMGIDDIHTLRAALRELVQIKKGSTIDPEQAKKMKVKELERKYIGAKIPGFFPTPDELIEKKINLLNIQPGDKILEPSAGLGHMADAAQEAGAYVTCIEINSGLAEVLREKGHNVLNEDFLSHSDKYDKILMNPPFENLQDIDHVRHAFDLLNQGGVLVATMANNKQREPGFLDWVNEYGYYEENPQGSFKSAFNPTGVSTITVYMEKN